MTNQNAVFSAIDRVTGRVLFSCAQQSTVPPEGDFDVVIGAAVGIRNAHYINGEFVSVPEEVPYTESRQMAYPGIGNQLDALWHAMDDGLIPMVPAFYDPIKAVKDANPKP